MGDTLKKTRSIDIGAFRVDQPIWTDLIRLDTTQDGQLEVRDLEPWFGVTVANSHWDRVATTVEKKDRAGLSDLIKEMHAKSFEHRAHLFSEKIPAKSLQELGAHIDEAGNIDLTGIPDTKLVDLGRRIGTTTQEIHQAEFPSIERAASTAEETLRAVGEWARGLKTTPTATVAGLTIFFNKLAYYYRPDREGILEAKQRMYSDEESYEAQQSPQISDLEEKFGIDFRASSAFGSDTWRLLDQALSELVALAGDRLPKLKKMSLVGDRAYHLDLIPAIAESDFLSSHITIRESLLRRRLSAKDRGKSKLNEVARSVYASRRHFIALPHFSVFKYVLAHELGHMLFTRSPMMVGYENWFSCETNTSLDLCDETFAEDYAMYLLSEGHQVISHREDGTRVPHYEERLALFRKHLPPTPTADKKE